MLKYICGFFLCVAVLLESAYVSPTYAASASVVITQIQAGGATSALKERIVIYNNSDEDVDVTNWCLRNKNAIEFACFTQDNPQEVLTLPSHTFATIASTLEVDAIGDSDVTIVYSPMNQSSGSIVGSNDSISLIDAQKNIIDTHGWTTGIIGGMSFARQVYTLLPLTYFNTDQVEDWRIQSTQPMPESGLLRTQTMIDPCDNTGDCIIPVISVPLQPLQITELLPNAIGSDVGAEFIELYNPNKTAIDISGYSLWYGPDLDTSKIFPSATFIPALSYISFTNSMISYTLLNSSSRVRITDNTGMTVDETPLYQDPKDGTAWALIDDTWQYTNQPTPGTLNLASRAELVTADVVETPLQKPCAADQYRSLDTNRCRTIVTTVSAVTPCKDNQYRSEETHRCRNIVSTNVVSTTCKEGQERNPDTNRCRTVKAVTKADYGVLGAQTTSSGSNWYLWLTIIGIILLALVYTLWEWRYELRKGLRKCKSFVRIRK
ncbi:MAG: lamin tail domain-containing protein [Candidatus Saccharimonadales bacterium]